MTAGVGGKRRRLDNTREGGVGGEIELKIMEGDRLDYIMANQIYIVRMEVKLGGRFLSPTYTIHEDDTWSEE